MPRLVPVSWGVFVRKMRELGWSGPHQEGRHPYMIKDSLSVTIPNPHQKEISVDLLSRILRQAMISRNDWVE